MTPAKTSDAIAGAFNLLPDWVRATMLLAAVPVSAAVGWRILFPPNLERLTVAEKTLAENVNEIKTDVESISNEVTLFRTLVFQVQTEAALQDNRITDLEQESKATDQTVDALRERANANRDQIRLLMQRMGLGENDVQDWFPPNMDPAGPLIGAPDRSR